MMWRSEDERRAQRGVQPGPESAGKARVAVRDEHVGKPHVAEDGMHKIARRNVGGSGLHGGNQPHAAGQEVNVHLQKVLARAGRWQFKEVQADAATASCRHRKGVEQTGRRQVVRLYALAGRARLDELHHVGSESWPPHRATGQREGLVAAKVATQRRCVEFLQNLQTTTTSSGYAQAIASRASAVEEIVPPDEAVTRGVRREARDARGGDGVRGPGLCGDSDGTKQRVTG